MIVYLVWCCGEIEHIASTRDLAHDWVKDYRPSWNGMNYFVAEHIVDNKENL